MTEPIIHRVQPANRIRIGMQKQHFPAVEYVEGLRRCPQHMRGNLRVDAEIVEEVEKVCKPLLQGRRGKRGVADLMDANLTRGAPIRSGEVDVGTSRIAPVAQW